MRVVIDGVMYVPQAQAIAANPQASRLLDALVSQWAGDNWQREYPDAPSYLRVVVSDGFDQSEGESLADFIARLLPSEPEAEHG